MKPFLKWAGNKYQIIETIKKILPHGKRLIEPFVGSGAVFLNTDYAEYLLSDNNAHLISLYQFLKKDGNKFINFCKEFFAPEFNNSNRFYEFRELFNTTDEPLIKAGLFVYLNKHCFNGLCRYNNRGEFNTPFGKYTKPYFPENEMLFFQEKSKNTNFIVADFLKTMDEAITGDVIYCDPPYVPLSDTAYFTNYSAGGFNADQQIQLAEKAKELANNGIIVVISNHHTAFTQKIYEGAELITLDVQRNISCNGANRKKAKEVLAVFC